MSRYVAEQMLSKKAGGMLTPLLGPDEDSTDRGSSDDDSEPSSKVETAKQTPMQKLKSIVVFVGLTGGAGVSAAAMVLSPAIAIFVMGGLCVANVPYSMFKEGKIGKLPSLRALHKKLTEEANRLEKEVDTLVTEINTLEPEANRAAEVEEELRALAAAQEVNVNKLVGLVKENEVILAQMRDNLRQRILQDIISIVVKSDKDNDQTIDRSEAKALALMIRLTLQEYGVAFDSEKFLTVVGNRSTVPAIIAVVQKLLPLEKGDNKDSDGKEEKEEGGVYDMFHMVGGEDSKATDGSTASGGNKRVSLMTCDSNNRKRQSVVMRRKAATLSYDEVKTLKSDSWQDY